MEWQPIKTAPKNGTQILVFFKGWGVKQVFWDDPHGGGGIWCVDDNKHGPYPLRGYRDGEDTYWMPTPPPPTT
jgi:hypothetical protein